MAGDKIALQLLQLFDHVVLEVGHVGPLFRLVEELYEWELGILEEPGEGHSVALHHTLLGADCGHGRSKTKISFEEQGFQEELSMFKICME